MNPFLSSRPAAASQAPVAAAAHPLLCQRRARVTPPAAGPSQRGVGQAVSSWPQTPCARWRARRGRAPHPIHAQAGVHAAHAGDADFNGDGSASLVAAVEATAADNGSSSGGGGGGAASSSGVGGGTQHELLQLALEPATAGVTAAAAVAAAQAQVPPDAARPSGGGGNFAKRVVSGLLLGLGGAAIILVGRLPFLAAALFVVYQATREYFGFVTSKGISQGMTPPPPFVSAATTALCLSITVFTYATGVRTGTAMCIAAFLLLAMNVTANRKPTFSQLTSSVFGLFYCGYLPCFWVKLRNLAVPAPEVSIPALAQVLPPISIGLVATFTTVACIIAADTGAYFVGKNLGRTKLTDISPKKTVEGAIGGMASAVAAALALRCLFLWPGDAAAAAAYGVLMFVSSIFGDLIESVMKREAGMKDSGDLIPGHGGLLDRFDSYMFSGAMSWFYLTFVLPRFGLA